MDRIRYIANIVIVALMFAAVSIQLNGRLLGKDVTTFIADNESKEIVIPIETVLENGTRVINSTTLAKDVIGFGGQTPIKLYVKDDKIINVEIEKNSETPIFQAKAIKGGVQEMWIGMTLSEAANSTPDVVSGATFTSSALIANIQKAAQHAANTETQAESSFFASFGLKEIAGILVILLGVFITATKNKNKNLMTVQLVLNVIVLGFWCGSFLSLKTIVTWMGNGINLSLSIVSATLLIVVLIMPLFKRKGSYCYLHCPMGSAQELLGRVPVKKHKISPDLNKKLNNLRYYILAGLLTLMWIGVGFDIMDYEIFSAFIVTSASVTVLVMAAAFLTLSVFITKPYCRFICPTGALITVSQKTKD